MISNAESLRRAREQALANKRARIADWAELERLDLSALQIARRMGLSARTVQRYRQRWRAVETDVNRVMRMLRDAGMWEKAA